MSIEQFRENATRAQTSLCQYLPLRFYDREREVLASQRRQSTLEEYEQLRRDFTCPSRAENQRNQQQKLDSRRGKKRKNAAAAVEELPLLPPPPTTAAAARPSVLKILGATTKKRAVPAASSAAQT